MGSRDERTDAEHSSVPLCGHPSQARDRRKHEWTHTVHTIKGLAHELLTHAQYVRTCLPYAVSLPSSEARDDYIHHTVPLVYVRMYIRTYVYVATLCTQGETTEAVCNHVQRWWAWQGWGLHTLRSCLCP